MRPMLRRNLCALRGLGSLRRLCFGQVFLNNRRFKLGYLLALPRRRLLGHGGGHRVCTLPRRGPTNKCCRGFMHRMPFGIFSRGHGRERLRGLPRRYFPVRFWSDFLCILPSRQLLRWRQRGTIWDLPIGGLLFGRRRCLHRLPRGNLLESVRCLDLHGMLRGDLSGCLRCFELSLLSHGTDGRLRLRLRLHPLSGWDVLHQRGC